VRRVAFLLVFVACGGDDPAPPPSVADPDRLSQTGLYSDFAARALAADVIPYAPAHPLWSDGARKERFLKLPPGTKIDTTDIDHWVFPIGTKAWKEFWVDGKLVETRLLWKKGPGDGTAAWWKVAFVWEPDGSDAVARPEGVPLVAGTTHDVPTRDDCNFCHMYQKDGIIGFSAVELAGSPLAARDVFTKPIPAYAVPGEGVVRDALGYMHGNCGFCHSEEGESIHHRPMHLRLLMGQTTPEQTGAYTTTFHVKMHHTLPPDVDEAIVPGSPDKSQMYVRMTAPNRLRMPPLATKVVDTQGSATVRDWITGLK
jgi:hypothetical protein